jgi:hypothetical protein
MYCRNYSNIRGVTSNKMRNLSSETDGTRHKVMMIPLSMIDDSSDLVEISAFI